MLHQIKKAHAARKNQNGFTLIELLIVIVILGILAGIVVFAVGGITDRGQASACKAEVKTIAVAEEANYAKNGSYATLANLVTNGFLRPGTPVYVQSADASNGSLTMVAGAPCSAG
ncbi:MAG TPA: prepilin-type N-terminal cleavage/methylation domain-containing protein [Kribbellaceae bacterium]|jgi:general secretion pathway protein G